MEEQSSLKDDFEKELDKINAQTFLSPEYKRRKTVTWVIRTIIAIVLFIIFWKHTWVRWALVAYIPLNLFSILSIHYGQRFLNKKVDRTRKKIEEAEQLMDEED